MTEANRPIKDEWRYIKYPETKIHATAIVSSKASLGEGVQVGPYSIIGDSVEVGDHTFIDSHVVIENKVRLGRNNRILRFSSIGTTPQDLKYEGEDTVLEIGDQNDIREYVNFSIGTAHGGGITRIGSGSLYMVNVHVGHDCQVGNNCVIANRASLAGHVEVASHAIIGGHSAVHQFCRVGTLAMIGGGSILVQDALPFCIVQGNHAETRGLNLVGIRRAEYSKEDTKAMKDIYRLVFRSNLQKEAALQRIKELKVETKIKSLFTTAIESSSRGFCR